MVVKDKCDSKEELLLWKSRFCTGGHDTDPTTYQPFDKTSPTASMDAVYMVLILAQRLRMNSAIKPLLAKYFLRADNFAKEFLQIYWSSSRKCFTDSPKPANYELLRDNLQAAGYIHKPNDTTFWRRIEQDCEERITAMSIALVFVDDLLHAWWTKSGSSAM